jgi:hypothetical protein
MQVHIQEKIKENPQLASAVEQATRLLEDEVEQSMRLLEDEKGPSNGTITADWSIVQEQGNHPLIRLTISEPDVVVEERYTLDQIRNANDMQGRLIRLWGKLLQVRSHKQLARLRQVIRQLDGE